MDDVDPIAAAVKAEQDAAGAGVAPAAPPVKELPVAAPVADEGDAIATQIKAEQDQADATQVNLLKWRAANGTADGARAADVLLHSAASNLSPEYVDRNLDAVKKKVAADKVNWNEVAYRQPALTKLLAEQPHLMPVVKDDVANLGGIEWALTAPGHALWDAINEQRTVARQFREASGAGSPENRQAIQDLEAKYSNRDYGAESLLSKGIIGAARMAPYIIGDVGARFLGGAAGVALGGGEGAAGGGAAGAPAAGVGAAPGAVGGGVVGGVGGGVMGQFLASGLFNYYESVGPLYWRLSNLKDANGEPMDESTARAFAQGGAAITGGLMSGFMGKYTSALPGVKQLLEKVGANTLEKALVDRTVTQAVKTGAVNFGKHWLTGATMMAAQSGVSAASEESAKGTSGQPFEAHWGNVKDAAWNGFKAGLQDMWLISAVPAGQEMIRDVGRARSSAEGAARLEALTDSAGASKALERLPDAVQKLVEKAKAEDGAVKSVFVPIEDWTAYWSSKKLDPGEVANQVLGDGGNAFAEAMTTKGDLVIPVEKYIKELGRTEHAEPLKEISKLKADDLTPRQFVEEQLRRDKQLEHEAKARAAELTQGKAQVADVIREQAVVAGIPKGEAEANAKIVSEYAGTMALRMGVSVPEAAALGAMGQLRILGPKGEAAAALAQEKLRAFLQPDAARVLEQRLATLSPENRAREYYVDEHVSGLPNRAHFNELPAPKGKGVVVITSTDVKPINDSLAGGHDVTNEFLRVIGKTLGEKNADGTPKYPGASRDGPNFLFHGNEADKEVALNDVRKALGNEHHSFVGGAGENTDAAFAAMDKTTKELRAQKNPELPQLPERGKAKPELDIGKLKFPEGKATSTVPADLVAKINQISPREYAEKAYLDEVHIRDAEGKSVPVKTGILTGTAWRALPRKAHVVSIDLKGLKAANNIFKLADGSPDNDTGNQYLLRFARLATHFGGSSFDLAHLSGDEYAAQSNDPAALEAFVTRLKAVAKVRPLELTGPGGEPIGLKVDFRHGFGPTYGKADLNLNAGRLAEASAHDDSGANPGGVRPEELPGGGDQVPARGLHLEAGDVAGGVGSADQGVPRALGRGGTPQHFGQEVAVAHIEGVPVTFNQEGDGARGSISFRLSPSGRPTAFDIRVLQGDRSTLAHETAHFLSWSLHDIATSDLATEGIRGDYDSLLKWAGYDSVDERLAQTSARAELLAKKERTPAEEAELKRLSAKEEKISHGWEQYLLEGKAPSHALARVFSKFRDWLTRIYKGVAGVQAQFKANYGEELGLSDDVRGIFDRLLAQDDALAQAQSDTGVGALPRDAAKVMSPAELEVYRRAQENARLGAEQKLAAVSAEQLGEKVQAARKTYTAEVSAELDAQPVYKAMRFLQRGELADGQGGALAGDALPPALLTPEGEPVKLSRAGFVKEYGADIARLMPSGIFGKGKSGVDVEQLAPVLGFGSGKELVDAFRKADPRDRTIAQRVQDKLDAEFGSTLKKLNETALDAVHSDAAAHASLVVLRAFGNKLGTREAARVKNIDLPALKKTAERLVAETAVGELDANRYARNERQAALKAAELWGKGKKPEAVEQLEARLFNQLLYRAAKDAQGELERAHAKAEGVSEDTRAALGKADPAYRDVHDDLLHAVGIGETPGAGRTLDQLLAKAKDDLQTPDFDVDLVRQLLKAPKDWEALSVDDARAVTDTLVNVRHLAAQSLDLDLGGKKLGRDMWFAELKKNLEGRKPLPKETYSEAARGKWSKLKGLGRGAAALLTDVPETYAAELDVHDRQGPVSRLLIDERLAAREKAGKLSKEVLQAVFEKWDKVPKNIAKLRDQVVDVDLPVPAAMKERFAPVYTRDNLWMLFLNWGNEGNRRMVREGNGWTDDKVQKALEVLTKPETDFLQGVLDAVQSLYPELAAVHEKRTGLKLGKVEATPISINGEQYAGGYFPLMGDKRGSVVGEKQDVASSLQGPDYVKPVIAASFRKARSQAVYPVKLTWGVVPAHLAQVIHDISYGDFVRQAGTLMFDKRFKDLTRQYLGEEHADQFIPWLRDLSNAKADSGSISSADFSDKLRAFARNRAATGLMGLRLKVMLPQVLDGWNARLEGAGTEHIAQAYIKVNAAMTGAIDLPELKLSKEIDYRDKYLKENMRARLGELGPTGHGVGHKLSEVYFLGYELSDRYTTRVTFKAAYDQALSDGFNEQEAAGKADDVLRRTYATYDIAEKPKIMRSSKNLAALLMFHTFANRQFNSLYRSLDKVGVTLGREDLGAGDKSKAVVELAAKLVVMGLAGAAVKYVGGSGPKKDEDVKKWLAWRVALEPFNSVPFFGGFLDREIAGQKASPKSAPEMEMVGRIMDHVGELLKGGKQDATKAEKAVALTEAMIGAFGGPTAQFHDTADYVRKRASGETRARNVFDTANGLMLGEGKDARHTPLSDIADLVGR